MLDTQIQKMSSRVLDSLNSRYHDILEDTIRKYAQPPIKGEITAGKLKWRGIKLVTKGRAEYEKMERWVEQRGKRIGPVITFSGVIVPFTN